MPFLIMTHCTMKADSNFLSLYTTHKPDSILPQSLEAILYYLDGLPASGKSSLAKQLSEAINCPIIETDAIAQQQGITYYQAAKQALYTALEVLARGSDVILDSFVIEDYLRQTDKLQQTYRICLIGLWCPLEALQQRFDQRSGVPGSSENCNLSKEYYSRYGTQSNDSIIHHAGSYKLEGVPVHYDYFFDARQETTQAICSHILLNTTAPTKSMQKKSPQ